MVATHNEDGNIIMEGTSRAVRLPTLESQSMKSKNRGEQETVTQQHSTLECAVGDCTRQLSADTEFGRFSGADVDSIVLLRLLKDHPSPVIPTSFKMTHIYSPTWPTTFCRAQRERCTALVSFVKLKLCVCVHLEKRSPRCQRVAVLVPR